MLIRVFALFSLAVIAMAFCRGVLSLWRASMIYGAGNGIMTIMRGIAVPEMQNL